MEPATSPDPLQTGIFHKPCPADLPEPTLSANARTVLENRYLAKDGRTGALVEAPRDLFWRVACAVATPEVEEGGAASAEAWARRFYQLMATGTFMPNSPTLMNAGREMGMLSACFVLPVEDSIDGIFSTLKDVALIQKAGGGTGFDFSALRPDGDLVSTSGGRTSGPLAFIDAFSSATEAIQQGAFRRGANMGVMRCDHPDVVEFILAKADLDRWTNYNVSVAVTDDWLRRVVDGPDDLMVAVNPRGGAKGWLRKTAGRRRSSFDLEAYAIGEPREGEAYWTYGEVFDLVVQHAWRNGEPGMLFLDRANRDNQVPHLGAYAATNPCGEQWLLPYGSCNLGSLDLGTFHLPQAPESAPWQERFAWEAFDRAVEEATRFLDDVISINDYPIEEIRRRADEERRIGLGVMGFADLLFRLGIRYGSEASLEVARTISARLTGRAIEASEALVAEHGRAPFGAWEGSRPAQEGRRPRRNSHLTTVAPTGTISIIAGCSGGIEPLFSLAFRRQVMKDADGVPTVMLEVDAAFEEAMRGAGVAEADRQAAVARAMEEGTIAGTSLPAELREVFVTAHDVTPAEHVAMQAAWQSSIDNAVSKTINLPHDADENAVREAYLEAWKSGCKGVTVYRDGCREMQPMALAEKKEEAAPQASAASTDAAAAGPLVPEKLPEIMPSVRIRQYTPFGNMHVKLSVDPQRDREMEVFAQLGKGGDVANSDLEAICRMLSLFLRCGGDLALAMQQLEGIGSSITVPSRDGRIMSLADGLAKALGRYRRAKKAHGLRAILLGEATWDDGASDDGVAAGTNGERRGSGRGGAFKLKCPSCEVGDLRFEEGCCTCHGCGYSQC